MNYNIQVLNIKQHTINGVRVIALRYGNAFLKNFFGQILDTFYV